MTKLLLAALLVVPALSLNAVETGNPVLVHNGLKLNLDAAPAIEAQGFVTATPNPFAKALVTLYTRIYTLEDQISETQEKIAELDYIDRNDRLDYQQEAALSALKTRLRIKTDQHKSVRRDLSELLTILKNLPTNA